MKKYFRCIFVLTLSIPAMAQNKSRIKKEFNGLIEIKYETLKNDKHIKNGRYQYFLAGYLLTEGTYKDNKKNGEWKYYCLDTSGVAFLGAYLNDVKVGKWIYSHQGKVLSEIDYNGYGKIEQCYVFSPKGDTIFAENNIGSQMDSMIKKEVPGFTQKTIMPSFPGGIPVLTTFLSRAIHFPQYIASHPNGGEVVVTFIVNKDGFIQNVKVEQSLDGAFDEEAVQVVKRMPRWSPGMVGGLPADVEYSLPIRFKR